MEKFTFEQLPQAVALLLEKVSRIEELLSGNPEVARSIKELLTTKEAATLMGISMSAVYKMTSQREVPVYKPSGKKAYLKREDLMAYMSRNRSMSREEIEREAANYVVRRPLKLG